MPDHRPLHAIRAVTAALIHTHTRLVRAGYQPTEDDLNAVLEAVDACVLIAEQTMQIRKEKNDAA